MSASGPSAASASSAALSQQPSEPLAEDTEIAVAANGSDPGEEGLDLVAAAEEKGPSRSELKNEAAREALDPLAEGERPTVVTVGAIVSALISASILIGYFAGVEVDRQRQRRGEARRPRSRSSRRPSSSR